jgi:hypothetical protein
MHAVRLALSLLLPVVPLASCADSTSVTVPAETQTPQFDAANAPSQSGPNVVRGPFEPGVLSGPDAVLAVAVGFEEPFADHCADFESPDQPGGAQIVSTPPGGKHLRMSGHDLRVVVFAFEGMVGNYCQDLAGAPVVATGIANLTLSSNDLVLGGAGPGADQVNVTIHGVLDLASGGQARLFATTHVLVRPDGSFAFDHTQIRLTPL